MILYFLPPSFSPSGARILIAINFFLDLRYLIVIISKPHHLPGFKKLLSISRNIYRLILICNLIYDCIPFGLPVTLKYLWYGIF